MGKLVRDRIPEIISAEGGAPAVRVLDAEQYRLALLDKLVEEAEEARASDCEHLLEELGDVYEVVLAALEFHGWSLIDLTSASARKTEERGGFRSRIWLE